MSRYGNKHRGGRPPIPEDERKSVSIRARVTGPQAEKLYGIARHRGVTLTALLLESLDRLLNAEMGRHD